MYLKNIITGLIGIITIYLVMFKFLNYFSKRYHGCEIHHEIYEQCLKSVVLKKYEDSTNHYTPTVIFGGNIQETMVFSAELQAIYDFVNIGDSVTKKRGSVLYKVRSKKTGRDTIFKFETTCKDSLQKKTQK